MNGLSFLVGNELFAVDVTLVQKVARKLAVTPVPSAPVEVIGIANLKGRVITVLSLSRLLGDFSTDESDQYLNIIVFKSGSGSDDQMGLAIIKPGNLIEIKLEDIKPPPVAPGIEGNFCISGVIEVDDVFYRIIDIDSIQNKYIPDIPGTDSIIGNSSFGGNEDESI